MVRWHWCDSMRLLPYLLFSLIAYCLFFPTAESDRDNETINAELECRSHEIYVRMEASIVPMLAGDTISFEGYRNCSFVTEGQYIVFRTGFDECGTTSEVIAMTIIILYVLKKSNKIYNKDGSTEYFYWTPPLIK